MNIPSGHVTAMAHAPMSAGQLNTGLPMVAPHTPGVASSFQMATSFALLNTRPTYANIDLASYVPPHTRRLEEKLQPRRAEWRAEELDTQHDVSISEVGANTYMIKDEDGFETEVKIEGKTLNVKPRSPEDTSRAKEVPRKRLLKDIPAQPWNVPESVERSIRAYFAAWHLRPEWDKLSSAIEHATGALLGWRIQGIRDEEVRERLGKRLGCIFDHIHIGEHEVKSVRQFREAIKAMAKTVLREIPEGTLLTPSQLIDYFHREGNVKLEDMSEKEAYAVIQQVNSYLRLLYSNVRALYVPSLSEVLIHPATYNQNSGGAESYLDLASLVSHEYEHATEQNGGVQGLRKFFRMMSDHPLHVLLNPFQEIFELLHIYAEEGAAMGASWEVLSRIPRSSMNALLEDLAETAGFSVDDLFEMNAHTVMKKISNDRNDLLMKNRVHAALLFYEFYDAMHMSKKEFLKAARIRYEYNWRLPFAEINRRISRIKKADGGKIEKWTHRGRHYFLVLIKLLLLALLIAALLDDDEEDEGEKKKSDSGKKRK